jgi:hypothetical protein
MVVFIGWDSALYRIHPVLSSFYAYTIPPAVRAAITNHVMSSKAKIMKRMEKDEREAGRKDFCSYIFDLKKEMGLSDWNMAVHSNSRSLPEARRRLRFSAL